jgi:tellurite resistance protein
VNIDAAQYKQIATIVYDGKDGAPTAAEAELVVALCQLAVAADDHEDPDEAALFDSIATQVYAHAKLSTTPPSFHPLDDPEQRRDLIHSTAAQLAGKPSAGLAYSLAYILAISDLDLAPEEGELLEDLCDALGIDADRADDLIVSVTEIITPAE